MITLLAAFYLLLAVLLTIHTTGTLLLLIFSAKKNIPVPPTSGDLPAVTVQLPIYNERYVVARLLEAVGKLDYPVDRLVVQLLDDSDDETTQIASHAVAKLRHQGFHVQHIRRTDRTGYKAGALAYGMAQSQTPFYATFDADFVPPPGFLRQTLPHLLADETLGMVQGRWGHLNPFENALTAAQSLAVDGHFIVEQTGRSRGGLLLNFNGTGGVWRADCIHDAGGWQAVTLTEDLDLSYRAQLRGWHLRTLPELVVPGELPPQLTAFKQQQSRWAKGSTQCLRLMLPRLWQAHELSFLQRVMGTLHLCQYIPYPLLLLLGVLAPILIITGVFQQLPMSFLLFSGVVPPLMYTVSQWRLYNDGYRRMLAFPALVVFGTGIAFSNTLAVCAAWSDNVGEFRRTPKFGTGWAASSYALRDDMTTYAELILALYMGWGTWVAAHMAPPAAPYLAVSALAYALFALWGFYDRWKLQQARMQPIHE